MLSATSKTHCSTKPSWQHGWLAGILGFTCVLFCCLPVQAQVTFEDHVLPVVQQHCSKCHGDDKMKADLNLTRYAALLQGGASGEVVSSGNTDDSILWKVLTHAQEPFMPPNRPKIPDEDLAVFEKWIAGGLLETSGSKAVAAARPVMDLTLSVDATGRPERPPSIPTNWPMESIIHTERGNPIGGLACSPWAPVVVAVAGQKQVLVFHTDTLELLGIVPFLEGQPATVRFSRSGTLLLAAGGQAARSGKVTLWDVTTAARLTTLGEAADTALAADLNANQSRVALGGPDRLVHIHSTGTGELLHQMRKHTDWVTAVAFSPNGEFLASADRNGAVILWDAANGQEIFVLSGHKSAVTSLSWRSDSKLLTSASEDGEVKLWAPHNGKQAKSWKAHGPGALSICYAKDGRLVTCGREKAITLWKPDGAKLRSLKFFDELPLRAVFSHDGKRVFATDFAGRVAVWNAEDGKLVGELDANPPLLADRIAAATKQVAELEPQVATSVEQTRTAESSLKNASETLANTETALAQAQRDLKESTKALAELAPASTNASAGETEQKRAASEKRVQAAEQSVAVATKSKDAATKAVEQAKKILASARAESVETLFLAAQADLIRLRNGQVATEAYHLREALTARKHEQAQLAASLQANRESLIRAEKELADSLALAVKAEQDAKTLRAEIERQQPLLKSAASEIEAESVRLKHVEEKYARLQNNSE